MGFGNSVAEDCRLLRRGDDQATYIDRSAQKRIACGHCASSDVTEFERPRSSTTSLDPFQDYYDRGLLG